MSVKILHAADFHLDSAFAASPPGLAAQRRRESRAAVERLSNYVNQNRIGVVLLAGDLFDGETVYRETVEQLTEALAGMAARVFIAPGNHDFYSARSLYATLDWPENVHIFKTAEMERVDLPELNCAVFGAAFTAPSRERGPLAGFRAPDDGTLKLGVLHTELDGAPGYGPVSREEIAASGLDYLALGHTHAFGGVCRAGGTAYAYSGCLEGRGFDECGPRGFLAGDAEPGRVDLNFVPFALRRYEILTVDVTGKTPESALRGALPEDTLHDLFRVVFTGETDERGVDTRAILERFAPGFFHLELRDKTHIGEDVWARAAEDSLRGEFLRTLRAQYESADEEGRAAISLAARFGLAALDHRDL